MVSHSRHRGLLAGPLPPLAPPPSGRHAPWPRPASCRRWRPSSPSASARCSSCSAPAPGAPGRALLNDPPGDGERIRPLEDRSWGRGKWMLTDFPIRRFLIHRRMQANRVRGLAKKAAGWLAAADWAGASLLSLRGRGALAFRESPGPIRCPPFVVEKKKEAMRHVPFGCDSSDDIFAFNYECFVFCKNTL